MLILNSQPNQCKNSPKIPQHCLKLDRNRWTLLDKEVVVDSDGRDH